MLKSGVFSLALLALAGAMTCPDGGGCDEGSTCCQVSTGRYGCCPLPRSFPMVHASFGNENDDDTVCPDETRCPSEYSCVKSHNTYQCCPLTQGVSCSDGKHCCLEDHLCTADGHSCIKKKAESIDAVVCPDGVSECPEESTCCQLPDDSWGCCLMAKAVCCEDRMHCCPEGSTCDSSHKCHSPTHGDTPMWEKLPARRRALWEDQTVDGPDRIPARRTPPLGAKASSVPCNDSVACPDGNTCCQRKDGEWTCCPLPEAVCCDDQIHCCPKDTICDVSAGGCDGATGSRPWLEKVPSLTRQPNKAGNVTCDSSHICPDGHTCCKTEAGDWACCPLPEAVCCDDHIHCCPKDTICDVSAGGCDGATGSRPWLEKVPSLTRQPNKAGNVTCDSSHICPDGHTCCKTETGDWACCPLPEAVCCDDHIHCCPKDTICDVSAGGCDGATGSRPWLEKVPSLTRQPNKAGNVTCDSSHICPDGHTCCKTETGDWACCPLPEAVCCDDHVHCCPKDTICDVSAGGCDGATGSRPWLEKVPSLTRQPNKAGNVTCDSSHICPDGHTCCKTETGDWACCPLPEAVCCDDHVHCCPKDTICDVSAGGCDGATGSRPWLEKVPSLTRQPNKAGNVTCDSSHICPDGHTCCKTETGDWACCPLPEAVCCDDHVHCCPKDTICDVSAGGCDGATGSRPWLEKVPSLTRQPNKAGNVTCDSSHICPDGHTCCKIETGDWACCPLPEAVCCDDHVHCCPKDTICDVSAGGCDGATGSRPWLEKVPSLTRQPNKAGNVKCDSSHICPDGHTCCKTEAGDWACCPLPEAVCCDDHVHCCPKDTICDVSAGGCDGATGSRPWLEKVPSLTRQPNKAGNVKCDSSHICPDGYTCCKRETGDWGCCPLPEAVCCSDMKHCCPTGYTCDPTTGDCSRPGKLNWDHWGAPFRKGRSKLHL